MNIKSKSGRLLNPNMRDDIAVAIRDLTDIEMQKREWLEDADRMHISYWDSLSYNVLIDLFYGNICLQATSEIGSVFYNEEEARKVQEFSQSLKDLISEISEDQPYNTYIENTKWLEMLKNAKQVYLMLKKNDQDNNFIECFSTFNRARISSI